MCAVRLSPGLTRAVGEPVHEAKGRGALLMLWSSFGDSGCAMGMACADSGSVTGPWRQLEKPLVHSDGGHGMVFRDFSGALWGTYHTPNRSFSVILSWVYVRTGGSLFACYVLHVLLNTPFAGTVVRFTDFNSGWWIQSCVGAVVFLLAAIVLVSALDDRCSVGARLHRHRGRPAACRAASATRTS